MTTTRAGRAKRVPEVRPNAASGNRRIDGSVLFVVSVVLSAIAPGGAPLGRPSWLLTETAAHQVYLPLVMRDFSLLYLDELSRATYDSITAMVEPSTGLPHDRFDASLFDIVPQLAVVRTLPYTNTAPGASLVSSRCTGADCRYNGSYGLKLTYNMPPRTYGSYSVDSPGFDVSQAAYLEAWVKGALGGERFEIVLWSDCQGPFPGRPDSALISVTQTWERRRIPLADFPSAVKRSSLCRLSIGFNDYIHPGGTVYLDQIAFVDAAGNRIQVPVDEETNVTNVGLYIASLLSALDLGWEDDADVAARLSTTLASVEAFQKWNGLPQTHNHVVSLSPSAGDRCISTVDLANFAAGLILLRQRVPELSARASVLLNGMAWDWLYDSSASLPYGCRYPDGSASTWHYDWLMADSRLAHFIGVGTGKMPPGSWNNLNRSHEPPRCTDVSLWHFEPGWDGGGLFMAFLPALFLDEAESELGTSARNLVRDQICRAQQIGAPAWGWSATALPPYGAEYCGYGCMRDDILVPHASILAIDDIGPSELIRNLRALEALGVRPLVTDGAHSFDFGFPASVNWQTHEAATVYLVLDQSMAFLSLVNYRTNGRIRETFCEDSITQTAMALISDYTSGCN